MARVWITYWRDIPVLVTAREGENEATVSLSGGFQDLVDRVAVQDELAEAEAYLAAWRLGPEEERHGSAMAVARAVAAELEAQLDGLRALYLRPPRRADQLDQGE